MIKSDPIAWFARFKALTSSTDGLQYDEFGNGINEFDRILPQITNKCNVSERFHCLQASQPFRALTECLLD